MSRVSESAPSGRAARALEALRDAVESLCSDGEVAALRAILALRGAPRE